MTGVVALGVIAGLFVVLPLALAAIVVVALRKRMNPTPGSVMARRYFQLVFVVGVFLVGFSAGIAVGTDQVPWVLLVEGALFALAGWYELRSQARSVQRT